jgi:hypothetical protein
MAAGDSSGGLGVNWRIPIAQQREFSTGIGQWLDEWGSWVAALLALLLLTCVAWPI